MGSVQLRVNHIHQPIITRSRVGLSCFDLIVTHDFDVSDFVGGGCLVLAAGCVLLGVKTYTQKGQGNLKSLQFDS